MLDLPLDVVPRGDRHPSNLFLLSCPGVTVFPELMAPVALQEPWALRTLAQAESQSRWVGFLSQADPHSDERPPDPVELGSVGCLTRVVRPGPLSSGTTHVLLQGVQRFRIEKILRREPYLIAKVSYPAEVLASGDEADALALNIRRLLQTRVRDSGAPDEAAAAALNIERKGALADFAAGYFVQDFEARRELLGELEVLLRLRRVHEELVRQQGIHDLGQRIETEIREKIEERQREFFLKEQLKALRRELGEEVDERSLDVENFREQLGAMSLPEAVRERSDEELRRLALLPAESPEASVIRGWLEWITRLPFGTQTEDEADLDAAQAVLDRDHAGLEEVKERILEFLAVRQRVPEHGGQILCLVGPPGVGKTSLGRSIADALGRSFARVSLGGVRDEAEIRGHRRTYVGAMPGRFVRGLRTAGSMNPVFVLDELDKLGQDFRGDPGSALLEVLDPAQNDHFSDHFLEVPIDLSRVFFVATANDLESVPLALQDRLEVLELPGYVAKEKLAIARGFLLPRQRAAHGLSARELKLPVTTLRRVVEEYTREAGVRGLDKSLARICRKAVVRLRRGESSLKVDPEQLEEFLGPPRYPLESRARALPVGSVLGLAWTPVGGDVLEVQATQVPGARRPLELTGRLGEVMQESTRIALSYLAGHASELGFEVEALTPEKGGLHVHFPAGAVKKDGPSAGVTVATALLSLARGQPVRAGLAMTGELTLTGKVLAVGGIRDKILAARRHGVRTVLLPAANRKDVAEIPPDLLKGARLHFVEEFAEVAELALGRAGRGASRAAARAAGSRSADRRTR